MLRLEEGSGRLGPIAMEEWKGYCEQAICAPEYCLLGTSPEGYSDTIMALSTSRPLPVNHHGVPAQLLPEGCTADTSSLIHVVVCV